jgi:phospholipase C
MRHASTLRFASLAVLGAAFTLMFAASGVACGSSENTTNPDPTGGDHDGSVGTADGGGVDPGADSGTKTDAGSGYNGPIPIKHVVVFVKENHTFDNYFGTFPGAEGTTKCKTSMGLIDCPHAADPVIHDMCHEHSCALTAYNGGKMDSWDSIPPEKGGDYLLPYGQYHEEDIPNYWAYAKAYTLGDHFFSGMLGPSFPGHFFTIAAQAGWAIGNPNLQFTNPYWGCDQTASTRIPILDQNICAEQDIFPCFKIPSVPDVLPKGKNWKFYGTVVPVVGTEPWSMFDAVDSVRNVPAQWAHVVDDTQFEKDIANKTLPEVSWVANQWLQSEHPNPGNICTTFADCSICRGENWTVGKINALMQSDYWKDTAIIITMDDWGGWYDHVAPPRQYGCDAKQPYGLGFRLPLMIISPYAKPHFIFKEVSEQASIPRFIERVMGSTKTLHDLDPAAQDAQANDLLNAFDFTQTPLPPLVLPLRTCK